jgi:hypothetical protein
LGPFALTASANAGQTSDAFGATVVGFSVTLEPELTLACLTGSRLQLCGSARGVLGYAAVSASPKLAGFDAKTQQGPALGAAAQAGATLALTGWLALDLDLRVGWLWAIYGSSLGQPVFSIGGAYAAVSLGLAAAWGQP